MRSISLTRVLAGLLLSTILAACGGGSGSGGGSASTPPVAATPAPAPLAYPIPSGLWTAPAAALPSGGNYVYLQSDTGDYIGAGQSHLYTDADSLLKLSTNGLTINASVQGNEKWTGSFLLPGGAGSLQASYFAGLAC